MKNSFTLALSLLTISTQALAVCVPARTVVQWPDDVENIGMYHRIHPSGKYIIASAANPGSGENHVAIIDLSSKENGKIVAKSIATPLIDETYPVEGTWNLLASPRNNDGMRYYKFDDVLKQQKEAKPQMSDPTHSQWYHSSAELPGSTKQNPKFRTMLYTGSRYRDYEMTYNPDGSVKETKISETKTGCGRTLQSPILSKNGTEVASMDGTTKIYKLKDNGECELVDDLGFPTSKVNFSYPVPGKKGQIVFYGQTRLMVNGVPQTVDGTFLYDRDTKVTKRLSLSTDGTPAYPGMTQDGRVIYINTASREVVIVDPNQLNEDGSEKADKKACIQDPDVKEAAPAPKPKGTAPGKPSAKKS